MSLVSIQSKAGVPLTGVKALSPLSIGPRSSFRRVTAGQPLAILAASVWAGGRVVAAAARAHSSRRHRSLPRNGLARLPILVRPLDPDFMSIDGTGCSRIEQEGGRASAGGLEHFSLCLRSREVALLRGRSDRSVSSKPSPALPLQFASQAQFQNDRQMGQNSPQALKRDV